MASQPTLAPPGAGLPLIEGYVARYILYPVNMLAFSWNGSLERLRQETTAIAALASPLSEEAFYTQKLIKRLPGLEDSSRYWSVGMTIEHLMITMKSIAFVISRLSKGEVPDITPSTADVKPSTATCIPREKMIHDFSALATQIANDLRPLEAQAHDASVRLPHPFFGPITARGWVWVLGMHQGLHRKQIERILAELKT